MKSFVLDVDSDVFYNFKKDAIQHDLWWDSDGTPAAWYVAFEGLGFTSYQFVARLHWLDDAEYTCFMLKYS